MPGFQLCEKCDKMITELFKETTKNKKTTVETLIEERETFSVGTAISFAEQGRYVKREGDEYAFTLREVSIDGGEEKTKEFCIVDENLETIGYKTFTTEDLLAKDYIIIK
jgi:hypothetical protein